MDQRSDERAVLGIVMLTQQAALLRAYEDLAAEAPLSCRAPQVSRYGNTALGLAEACERGMVPALERLLELELDDRIARLTALGRVLRQVSDTLVHGLGCFIVTGRDRLTHHEVNVGISLKNLGAILAWRVRVAAMAGEPPSATDRLARWARLAHLGGLYWVQKLDLEHKRRVVERVSLPDVEAADILDELGRDTLLPAPSRAPMADADFGRRQLCWRLTWVATGEGRGTLDGEAPPQPVHGADWPGPKSVRSTSWGFTERAIMPRAHRLPAEALRPAFASAWDGDPREAHRQLLLAHIDGRPFEATDTFGHLLRRMQAIDERLAAQ